jgi:hypothetical protein
MIEYDEVGPLNDLARKAFDIAKSGDFDAFLSEFRKGYEIGLKDGQSFVWKLRSAVKTDDGILFPGDEGYVKALGTTATITSTGETIIFGKISDVL